jgi:transposase
MSPARLTDLNQVPSEERWISRVTCGIDWSEKHHDVALLDQDGQLIARERIMDDAAGWKALLELSAKHGDTPQEPIPVAIETGRGLLVACLRATGRKVYAINPLGVARYRERHTAARSKDDHADAMTLANILRVDAAHHQRCQPTPNWSRRSRYWPEPNRTRSRTASSWPTNSVPCCASTPPPP